MILSEDEFTKACLASVCGETDKALELLRTAVKKKQREPEEVRTDDDLSFIRDDPRYEQVFGEQSAQDSVATAGNVVNGPPSGIGSA
jgi:hypothetical protein